MEAPLISDLFDVFGAIKLILLDLSPSRLEDKPS
jgi:hypothetical protein